MVVHYSIQKVCETEFLIAKIDKEIYENETSSQLLKWQLEEKFKILVYLYCEESKITSRGKLEWICGYINIFEPHLSFETIELE